MLLKSRPFLLLLGTYMLINVGAAFAQTMAPVIGGPVTSYDMAPILTLGLQGVALLLLIGITWFAYTHIKNKDARDAIVLIAEKAVSFGLNAVAGATKDKPLNVNVGSSVVATALKYVNQFGPEVVAKFGLDQASLAKMLVARLPGVDGQIDDATIARIVATASSTPGSTASAKDVLVAAEASLPELAQLLGDYLIEKKKATQAPTS